MTIPWLAAGGYRFDFTFRLTPLSSAMALLVATVSVVVFLYALRYMKDDPRRARFFSILTLFVAAMLALVMSAGLITLFMAWEIVGICSYLLIGFWFEKPAVPAAASLAFITTRIGDVALLGGFLLLIIATGGSDIDRILALSQRLPPAVVFAATLLMFIGAASKSAQIPFQTWLPEAMAGPTPVSALLHSATMVAAGVFLVARFYPLFTRTPQMLTIIAWTGAISALYGSIAALVVTDLKRALAYSTISQLGLMYAGLGSGSLIAGVLLLIAQALYKSTLFLGAGVVDHIAGGTELERMGGLRRAAPITFVAFLISAAALAGLPVTLAFPPKDATLAAAWGTSRALFLTLLVASLLTALYSARLVSLIFLGLRRDDDTAAEDRALATPVIVLATLVVIGLTIDSPLLGVKLSEPAGITFLAISIAAAGFLLGFIAQRRWRGRVVWPPLERIAGAVRIEFGLRPATMAVGSAALAAARSVARFDAFAIDPLPDRAATALLTFVRGAAAVDRAVFDRVATVTARAGLDFIRAARSFDHRALDSLVDKLGEAAQRAGGVLRKVQTGRLENYLLMIYAWFFAVIAAMVLIVFL